VEQGLAQTGTCRQSSVVWDIGPAEEYHVFSRWYRDAGSPYISALVISHTHSDHYGGLVGLDTTIRFSGRIVTSAYADTGLLRRYTARTWRDHIFFTPVCRGDTLDGLDDVTIHCLWPPRTLQPTVPITDSFRNHAGLVFSVHHGHTSFLLTADIDTAATRMLSLPGHNMDTAVHIARYVAKPTPVQAHTCLVLPHHGGMDGFDPVFCGYVDPEIAVISCARDNTYGHPFSGYHTLLAQMQVQIHATYATGTCTFTSNGAYVTCR
jgi:competence protein ComEC